MGHKFTVVTTDGESLGVMEFAVPNMPAGAVIPLGAGRGLRVVNVLQPEAAGQLQILVVESTA